MTGSLHVKNDKYYMVINMYENGKRKQKWIGTGLDTKGNKKRAERMLKEAIRDMENEEATPDASELGVGAVVQMWLDNVRLKVDLVTYHGYKDIAENHVIPYFSASGLSIGELRKRDIQRYVNEKADHGRKDGKGGLSASSLRLHKNVIYQTCKYAISEEMIPTNPCEGVQLPKRSHINYHFYSSSQISQLLQRADGDVLCPLIQMTAVYGLRRSEVLGLQWDAVDFENDSITIQRTVTKVYERIEKEKTKNKSSYRSYPMLPDIREMLLKMRESEAINRTDFGDAYCDNQYIFKWPNGRPFDPDYITHHFSDLLRKCDMPHIRFHELRHSCASILIVSGFTLKDVQEWLGHASIDMTADIYSHLDFQRKVCLGTKMSEAIRV